MKGVYAGACALGYLIIASSVHAIIDLNATRNMVDAILNEKNPEHTVEFKRFFRRYDDVVESFFDKKNNDSLKTHITKMETELQTLKSVCDDVRYGCISSILCTYYEHITELIDLLRHYIGSHDTLSLAFKVREFKAILPETVRQRGDISLFKALYHRLRC